MLQANDKNRVTPFKRKPNQQMNLGDKTLKPANVHHSLLYDLPRNTYKQLKTGHEVTWSLKSCN